MILGPYGADNHNGEESNLVILFNNPSIMCCFVIQAAESIERQMNKNPLVHFVWY